MNKTKKIVISLSVSLIFVLILNFILNFKSNNNFVKVPIFNKNILKNEFLRKEDISYVDLKKTSITEDMLDQILCVDNFELKTLKKDVFKGEFVLNSFLNDNSNEDIFSEELAYEYLSLPVSNDSLAICKGLKFGDKVDIYYTAKLKDVDYALKEKLKVYSNSSQDGYVTCLLFENVEVVNVVDANGSGASSNFITNILIRLTREDALVISNLKNVGTIDILKRQI